MYFEKKYQIQSHAALSLFTNR